ncbi:unnamed protein product [Rhizoctonia solani]|uniref:Uncharacterized protein n=1 Tax=Rhizoctonia solani TaxID=456999 RepID=A0A8H3CH04_9AGAM|nr:unnamed protein product [Rhizoctonia solani]
MPPAPPRKQTKPPLAVKSGTKEEGPDAKKDQVTSAKSASIWDTYMDMAKPKDGATLDEWEGLLDVTLGVWRNSLG